jgi:ubiquitin thioesterase OTU1
VDVGSFKLRCEICKIGIVGQVEAQDHAKQTGHVKFCEY